MWVVDAYWAPLKWGSDDAGVGPRPLVSPEQSNALGPAAPQT